MQYSNNNTPNNNPKAKDPFVRLDKAKAIINNLDYDSNGRLTYMPFNGVECEQGKDNKIISTPDAYSTALAYTDWCVKAINATIFNINPNVQEGFARVALSNIDYILTDRLSQEVATAIITVFDAGTRQYFLNYANDAVIERGRFNKFCNDSYYIRFNKIFEKDVYVNGELVPDTGYQYNNKAPRYNYISDAEDAVVKSCRIISFIAADIANIYSNYINEMLNNIDIHRFASESIATLGLDRSMISEQDDYPYISSILHESAHNDINKVVEIVEMLVNHAYYVFMTYYQSYAPALTKKIEDKNTPPRYIPSSEGLTPNQGKPPVVKVEGPHIMTMDELKKLFDGSQEF